MASFLHYAGLVLVCVVLAVLFLAPLCGGWLRRRSAAAQLRAIANKETTNG